jgi:hypothetical protein
MSQLITEMRRGEAASAAMGGQVSAAFSGITSASRSATQGTSSLAAAITQLDSTTTASATSVIRFSERVENAWKKVAVAFGTGVKAAGEIGALTIGWSDMVRKTYRGTAAFQNELGNLGTFINTEAAKLKRIAKEGGWSSADAATIRASQVGVFRATRRGEASVLTDADSSRLSNSASAGKLAGASAGDIATLQGLLLGGLRQDVDQYEEVMSLVSSLGSEGLSAQKSIQTIQESFEDTLRMDQIARAEFLKKQLIAAATIERSAQDFGKYTSKLLGTKGMDRFGEAAVQASFAGVSTLDWINAHRGTGLVAKQKAAAMDEAYAKGVLRSQGMTGGDYQALLSKQNRGDTMSNSETMRLLTAQQVASSLPGDLDLGESLLAGQKVRQAESSKPSGNVLTAQSASALVPEITSADERVDAMRAEVANAIPPWLQEIFDENRKLGTIIQMVRENPAISAILGLGAAKGALAGGKALMSLGGKAGIGRLGSSAMGGLRGLGGWASGLFTRGGARALTAAASGAGTSAAAAGSAGAVGGAAATAAGGAAGRGLLGQLAGRLGASFAGKAGIAGAAMSGATIGSVGLELSSMYTEAKGQEIIAENNSAMQRDMAFRDDMARKFSKDGKYFAGKGAVPFSDLNRRRSDLIKRMVDAGYSPKNFGALNRAAYLGIMSGKDPTAEELVRSGAISKEADAEGWTGSVERFMEFQRSKAIDASLFGDQTETLASFSRTVPGQELGLEQASRDSDRMAREATTRQQQYDSQERLFARLIEPLVTLVMLEKRSQARMDENGNAALA